jgi:hypothetical protein
MKVECPDRIAGWLEELSISSDDSNRRENDESVEEQSESFEPTTPPRRASTPLTAYEEVSPTDTSFSGHSIFDAPTRKNLRCGSPTSKYQIRDDTSDITSVGDDVEWGLSVKEQHLVQPPPAPNFARRASSPPTSVVSYDPSSNAEEDEANVSSEPAPDAGFPLYDPIDPRLVWITSCLQCTLANLPCSRTHPACSRCKRKGCADDCLLHRRSFAIEALDPEKCKVPILLKVRGDEEETWQRKLGLAEDLRKEWVAEQEKDNWVMPDIGSPRVTLKERVQVLQGARVRKKGILHPGEGMGRISYKVLVVDLDV